MIDFDNDWAAAVSKFESEQDINFALHIPETEIGLKVNEANRSIRILFLILDYLVEAKLTSELREELSQKLKSLFELSLKRFSEDPEFLAFAGMLITRGEWYFEREFEEGISMIRKAVDLKPDNLTFRSFLAVFEDQRLDHNVESKRQVLELFFSQGENPKYLECKGAAGKYALGILEETLLRLKSQPT